MTVTTEATAKRVRVIFGGETIADSTNVLLLFEPRHRPVYYFPPADVRSDLLELSRHRTACPHKGEASHWSIVVGERRASDAVWCYESPRPGRGDIAGRFAFYWNRVDAWFEEDEEVFVHARDPHHRIDVLHSSRHVKVTVAGTTVAETRRPVLLFETGLPVRYYLPRLDARLDLLRDSDTRTSCPYKGDARHFSVEVGGRLFEDVAWSYPIPRVEVAKIENLLCFYQERVDAIEVDGLVLEVPDTQWGRAQKG